MFQFFEQLVDPYVPYEETDTPPQRLWPFLRQYTQPFKKVFWAAGVMSILGAIVEIWLLSYMGRLVDMLTETGAKEVWNAHSVELLTIALFILLARPIIYGTQVSGESTSENWCQFTGESCMIPTFV